jgi:hypothetical protein
MKRVQQVGTESQTCCSRIRTPAPQIPSIDTSLSLAMGDKRMNTTTSNGTDDPYLDRATAAAEISATKFPVSTRSIRDWPLPETVEIGGRACALRSDWLEEADRRLHQMLFRKGETSAKRRSHLDRAREVLAAQRGD